MKPKHVEPISCAPLAAEIAEVGPWVVFQSGVGPNAEVFAISENGTVRDLNISGDATIRTIERALALGVGIEPITADEVSALWALEHACQVAFIETGARV